MEVNLLFSLHSEHRSGNGVSGVWKLNDDVGLLVLQ